MDQSEPLVFHSHDEAKVYSVKAGIGFSFSTDQDGKRIYVFNGPHTRPNKTSEPKNETLALHDDIQRNLASQDDSMAVGAVEAASVRRARPEQSNRTARPNNSGGKPHKYKNIAEAQRSSKKFQPSNLSKSDITDSRGMPKAFTAKHRAYDGYGNFVGTFQSSITVEPQIKTGTSKDVVAKRGTVCSCGGSSYCSHCDGTGLLP